MEPCAQNQRDLVEGLWTPEIDIRPTRFGPGSWESAPGSVYDEKWVQYAEVPRLVVIRPGGA